MEERPHLSHGHRDPPKLHAHRRRGIQLQPQPGRPRRQTIGPRIDQHPGEAVFVGNRRNERELAERAVAQARAGVARDLELRPSGTPIVGNATQAENPVPHTTSGPPPVHPSTPALPTIRESRAAGRVPSRLQVSPPRGSRAGAPAKGLRTARVTGSISRSIANDPNPRMEPTHSMSGRPRPAERERLVVAEADRPVDPAGEPFDENLGIRRRRARRAPHRSRVDSRTSLDSIHARRLERPQRSASPATAIVAAQCQRSAPGHSAIQAAATAHAKNDDRNSRRAAVKPGSSFTRPSTGIQLTKTRASPGRQVRRARMGGTAATETKNRATSAAGASQASARGAAAETGAAPAGPRHHRRDVLERRQDVWSQSPGDSTYPPRPPRAASRQPSAIAAAIPTIAPARIPTFHRRRRLPAPASAAHAGSMSASSFERQAAVVKATAGSQRREPPRRGSARIANNANPSESKE